MSSSKRGPMFRSLIKNAIIKSQIGGPYFSTMTTILLKRFGTSNNSTTTFLSVITLGIIITSRNDMI